jgi:hypothetical protein
MCWWIMPIILATWKVEIRKIIVQDHPEQKFLRPLPSLSIAGCSGTSLSSQATRETEIKRIIIPGRP